VDWDILHDQREMDSQPVSNNGLMAAQNPQITEDSLLQLILHLDI